MPKVKRRLIVRSVIIEPALWEQVYRVTITWRDGSLGQIQTDVYSDLVEAEVMTLLDAYGVTRSPF